MVRRDRTLCACIRGGTRRVSDMCAGSEDGSGPPWSRPANQVAVSLPLTNNFYVQDVGITVTERLERGTRRYMVTLWQEKPCLFNCTIREYSNKIVKSRAVQEISDIHTYIHTHTHTYIHTYIYIIHTYTYIHIYIYRYVYIQMKSCSYIYTMWPVSFDN